MVVTVQVTSNPGASSRSTHRLCVFPCKSCKPKLLPTRQWAKAMGSGNLTLGCPRACLLFPQAYGKAPPFGSQPTAFCQLAYLSMPLASSPTALLALGWEPSHQHRHWGYGSSKDLAGKASSKGVTVLLTSSLG